MFDAALQYTPFLILFFPFFLLFLYMISVVTNRQLQQHPKLQPRIMVVQLSKDISSTYNAVMNSIFRCLSHLLFFS